MGAAIGIGLGIVLRGEIYRGAYGGAGEFGHVKVGGDLLCECGVTGCLEAVASEVGICGQVATLRGVSSISIDEVLALAPSDQPPMVGTVTWKDNRFIFKAIGGPPDDQGLNFSR